MENEITFDFDKNRQFYLEHIKELWTANQNLMDEFKSKTYPAAFHKYMEESRPVLEGLERACLVKEEEREQIIEECVEGLLEAVEDGSTNLGKMKKNSYLESCKMVFALFTVPMVLELKLDVSQAFTDLLTEKWADRYPQYTFKKGTYAVLMEGFDKRKYCYITTAVCRGKNKPDDCLELSLFRQFRDGYLSLEEDGAGLIERYYEKAPAILQAIELSGEKAYIYEYIWSSHLKPCLSYLERGQYKLCKETYIHMVETLEETYIPK